MKYSKENEQLLTDLGLTDNSELKDVLEALDGINSPFGLTSEVKIKVLEFLSIEINSQLKILKQQVSKEETNEPKISLSFQTILDNYDFNKLCEIKGFNPYMINEGRCQPEELIELTISEAKQIGFSV